MKKAVCLLLSVVVMMFLASAAFALKATTVTPVDIPDSSGKVTKRLLIISFTADDGTPDAAVADAVIDPLVYKLRGWYWYDTIIDPGAVAPTAAYDISVTSLRGVVVSSTLLNDLSATVSTRTNMGLQAGGYPPMMDTWTWSLANNSVANATGVCIMFFTEQ